MHTTYIQLPTAGRPQGRYSDEFKRQIMAACKQLGVPTEAVALANGLDANVLRRWISESQTRLLKSDTAKQTMALALQTQTQFIALEIQSGDAASANVQIELQRSATTVRVQWQLVCAAECAAWLAARRLHQGRFVWPPICGVDQFSLSHPQLDHLVLSSAGQRMGDGGTITMV
ncbi:transposase [Rhodoferax aquaticus]|uniref:Transposase n=1 Tax=Rhodoferax aquaticus TaxID=2527691 RepID=A0A515ESX9_9BURK|nr:transposase [Rhodoferax aquaticus]QDL55774.1 hypothetical protein EXZ61_17220 [Rhodoferax aquaticus]